MGRRARASITPWPVTEPLPSLLDDQQLMRVLQLSQTKFYELRKAGAFTFLEARRIEGMPVRYSGRLVGHYRDGDGALRGFSKRGGTAA